jgi:hypothetical protein
VTLRVVVVSDSHFSVRTPELELPDHKALAPTWIEPGGMAQLTLGEDVPSPYEPAATEAAP